MPAKSGSKIITRDPGWLGPAIPPGEILLEANEEITAEKVEKRGITADTALRIARLFNTSPQFWMRLQADWDLHLALQAQSRKAS